MSGAPVHFVPTLTPEDAARADFYALLARLFYAPPDGKLLESIAAAGDLDAAQGDLARAWRDLKSAAGVAAEQVLKEEYDTAFVGTGKAPVTLYACAYSLRYTNEAPLARLRGELSALGVARRESASEPEDHIALLCEVMRFLIAEKRAGLQDQKQFFERWIWPNAEPLCAAIKSSGATAFYKSVAALLSGLCTLEHAAFELL